VTEKLHVDLSGPPQTMLATFYAKALDADLPRPILGDRFAKEIVDRIDYDWKRTAITAANSPSVTTRSAHFDNWVRQFLAVTPEAVVLHLGCGLDARFFRLDPGPAMAAPATSFNKPAAPSGDRPVTNSSGRPRSCSPIV
jgi:O-methyltransferase involved in polyketide biosynthesis